MPVSLMMKLPSLRMMLEDIRAFSSSVPSMALM